MALYVLVNIGKDKCLLRRTPEWVWINAELSPIGPLGTYLVYFGPQDHVWDV